MKIKIRDALPEPSSYVVSEVERKIGRPLPNEYIKSLQTLNGAHFDLNEFSLPNGHSAGVTQFLPFDHVIRHMGYMKQTQVSGYAPIAHAEGGNYVCVSLKDGDFGQIYFFDHEIPGYDALSRVGDSLNEFLDSLREFKIDDVFLDPVRIKEV
ncbi:SMI1/KNR4 family protein [Paraburkholderia heleia]|uniref:SMI1/KNR4 family protein n=1 Tax=Paraburkholderia heleia TaxID=634127 RepID=UPI001427E545|nr:SMI1/KNR4 family protein [Paraburkholderia heleia]